MEEQKQNEQSPPVARLEDKSWKDEFIKKAFYAGMAALASAGIGIGSAYVTSERAMAKMEQRLVHAEQSLDKHDNEYTHLMDKVEDHNRRIARLEAHTDTTLSELAEIKRDIKAILQLWNGNARH